MSEQEEHTVDTELESVLFLAIGYKDYIDRMVNNEMPGWAFQFYTFPEARMKQSEFQAKLEDMKFTFIIITVNPYHSSIVIVEKRRSENDRGKTISLIPT